MSDRPIIFSGPMVHALLAGRKTQTRRLATSPLRRCAGGDRLYVREGFALEPDGDGPVRVIYSADNHDAHVDLTGNAEAIAAADRLWTEPEHWRPLIHMPRWASRLTLIVETVRVEPLRAISEEDAVAEGLAYHVPPAKFGMPHYRVEGLDLPQQINARMTFAALWCSLHTKPGERWGDNPQVVALTFRVEHHNIDAHATPAGSVAGVAG